MYDAPDNFHINTLFAENLSYTSPSAISAYDSTASGVIKCTASMAFGGTSDCHRNSTEYSASIIHFRASQKEIPWIIEVEKHEENKNLSRIASLETAY